MGILHTNEKPGITDKSEADKSMYVSDAKIDRNGVAWKKKLLWIREEHLGKLKVISHFKNKNTSELVDEALSGYIRSSWDDSMAVEKMVKNKTAKIPIQIPNAEKDDC